MTTKLGLLLFVAFFQLNLSAFAQEVEALPVTAPDKVTEDLTNYFSQGIRTLSCDYSKKVLEELKTQNDIDLDKTIEDEMVFYKGALESKDLLKSEKKILKSQIEVLEKFQKLDNRKAELTQFYSSICNGTQTSLGVVARSGAHFFNGVNLAVTFPVRFLFKFFKAVIDGKHSDGGRRSLRMILGRTLTKSVSSYVFWKGVNSSLIVNPLYLPVFVSPMADFYAMKICDEPNELNPKEMKFCKNYNHIKDMVYKGTEAGEKWGAWLHAKVFGKPKAREEVTLPEVKENNLCEALVAFHKSLDAGKVSERGIEMFRLLTDPGQLSVPSDTIVRQKESLLVQQPLESRGKLRSVIISLGPTAEDQDLYKAQNMEQKAKDLDKTIAEMDKNLKKLYKRSKKDVVECVELKTEIGFSWDKYLAIKKERDGMLIANAMTNNKMIEAQVKKVSKGLLNTKSKLKWEVITTNDVKVIHSILRDKTIGNIVITTHGKSNGKLVDGAMDELPSRFFADISPSIMSISFYSCFSQKIKEVYNLEEKFSSVPSYHAKKHFFFVGYNKLSGGDNFAPVVGFKDYLLTIDKELLRTTKANLLVQTLMGETFPTYNDPICKMKVDGLKVEEGTLALTLNRKSIGFVKKDQPLPATMSFPCRFFDAESEDGASPKQILNIHGLINPFREFKMSIGKIDLSLEHPNKSMTVESFEIFKDKNKNDSSIMAEIDLK